MQKKPDRSQKITRQEYAFRPKARQNKRSLFPALIIFFVFPDLTAKNIIFCHKAFDKLFFPICVKYAYTKN